MAVYQRNGTKHRATCAHQSSVFNEMKVCCFKMFLTQKRMQEFLLPATSNELKENVHGEMSLGEFLGWLGCRVAAQAHPVCHPSDLFPMKPRDKCWNPCLGDAMSDKRLKRLSACLKFYDEKEALEHKDRFFWMRKLNKGFNHSMDMEFNPSDIVWLDESMVYFHDYHSLGRIYLDRKPHPMGNKYRTTACREESTTCYVEWVEGYDRLVEGACALLEFELEAWSKITSLYFQMTKLVWDIGPGCMLDSGFG